MQGPLPSTSLVTPHHVKVMDPVVVVVVVVVTAAVGNTLVVVIVVHVVCYFISLNFPLE